jgi:hypothetical protein
MKKNAITAAKAFLIRTSKRSKAIESFNSSPQSEHEPTLSGASVPEPSESRGKGHATLEKEEPSVSPDIAPTEADPSMVHGHSPNAQNDVNSGLL